MRKYIDRLGGMPTAPSLDVTGLVLVVHRLELDPQAACEGHSLTHVVERVTWLDAPDTHVTLGQLLARVRYAEGDRLEVRWPTVAEERVRLTQAIDDARKHGLTRSAELLTKLLPPPPAALHDWRDPARPEARRDADGLLCADPDGAVE